MGLDDPKPLTSIAFRPPEHPTWTPGGLAGTSPMAPDHACRRCSLYAMVKTVCMESFGKRGGTLLVLGTPTSRDDAGGGLVQSGGNDLAITEARKAGGLLRVTWALRCAAGRGADDNIVQACRPYLADEVSAATRVVALGSLAMFALTGHEIDARRVRRAKAHILGVPVFAVADPGSVVRNRFWRIQFRDDMAWALSAPDEGWPDGEVRILDSAIQAVEWLVLAARSRLPLDLDTEHWPGNPWAPGEFRLLCLGLCNDPTKPVVIPEDILLLPSVRDALRLVLEDPAIPKVNQNIKHDRHVIWRALGVDIIGVEHDTMIYAKLRDSENPAGLAKLNWKTGFGGYKELGHQGSEEEDDET